MSYRKVVGRILVWALILLIPLALTSCGENVLTPPTYSEPSGNAPRVQTASAAGPVINVFPAVWQTCGGSEGVGRWLGGPFWYGNRLVMVYTNMVLAWDVAKVEMGVVPLHLNSKSHIDSIATPAPKMHWWDGVNVPTPIWNWIARHGSQYCSGKPVGALTKRGDKYCQDFENVTLCYSAQGNDVAPLPLGKEFLKKHRSELHPTVDDRENPDWELQIAPEIQGQSVLHLALSLLYRAQQVPSGPVVAVWARRNDADAPFFYQLFKWKGGVWQTDVLLPSLESGSVRFVVGACVFYNGLWQSCSENSVQWWSP